MSYAIEGLCLPAEFLVMGALANNVYIIGNEETSVFVVDPCCDAKRILEALDGRVPEAIVLTHCHWDHVGAAADLREATGAKVVASAIDGAVISGDAELGSEHRRFTPCPIDQVVADGDVLELAGMPWKVIATPGHTPGGICLFADPQLGGNPEGAPILVSGDTLFCGTIGRTDFAEGSMDDMRKSLKKLAVLPDETVVLPGHNNLTRIGNERQRVFAYFA